MNLAALLHNAAAAFGHRPALSLGERVLLDYRGLQARVARLAAGLRGAGLKPGDRVALVMSNRPCYLELLFAIWHAGLVAVPVNARLHPREVAFILQDCGVSLLFVTGELAEAMAQAAVQAGCVRRVVDVDHADYEHLLLEPAPTATARGDDLAWIFYTSGTTGRPKGAMLTHRNLQLMAWSYLCDVDFLTEQDSLLHLGPQSHAAGLFGLSFVAKGAHHVMPESGGFEPGELVSLIGRYPSATFFLAPTMLRRLVADRAIAQCRVENVRTLLCGAAPIYASDVRGALAVFGPRFWNGYGQGECPCTITAMPKHLYAEGLSEERLTSVGIVRTGVEVCITDDRGKPLPPGEVGEITVRGDVVMRGYWNNPEATARALRDGWLFTGDLGVMDAEGYLWLKDRSKDLIISGGANIYPREVEEVLLSDPAVAEAAVVGRPDPQWGESVVAFVVPRAGAIADPARLDRLCLDNIARFKRPRQYVVVPELPRNNTGKVLKTELRVRLARQDFPISPGEHP
jgi:acyl-CoA synthetase (AMP-forming)/AMP-acid ligase II